MIESTSSAFGSSYRLYGSLQSGHSYKVRMALLLWNLPHDYRSIDLSVPAAERDPEWRRASRFGEVPVLICSGRALCQSNAILLHLARTHGILGWERDPELVGEWLFWEANRIGLSLPNYRSFAFSRHRPNSRCSIGCAAASTPIFIDWTRSSKTGPIWLGTCFRQLICRAAPISTIAIFPSWILPNSRQSPDGWTA